MEDVGSAWDKFVQAAADLHAAAQSRHVRDAEDVGGCRQQTLVFMRFQFMLERCYLFCRALQATAANKLVQARQELEAVLLSAEFELVSRWVGRTRV